MSEHPLHEPTLDEQAHRWLQALRAADDSSTRRAFGLWIKRSPEHLNAFLRQQLLSTELQELDLGHRYDVQELIARAKATTKVVPWPVSPPDGFAVPGPVVTAGRAKRYNFWFGMAAALGTIALVSALTWWSSDFVRWHLHVYTTSTGEQRQIVLPDGSTLNLNTQSSARVDFSDGKREVYLLGGEVLFDVHHDASTPFRVHVHGTLIKDLGTQFSVHSKSDMTLVSVVHGVVEISVDPNAATSTSVTAGGVADVVVTSKGFQPVKQPVRLAAGDGIALAANGSLMQRSRVDVAQATAWRRGRVSFANATLDEIATEFNRYNARKILIHGDSLRTRRYSGEFNARDPESFIDYLRQDDGIEVEDSQNGLVVTPH